MYRKVYRFSNERQNGLINLRTNITNIYQVTKSLIWARPGFNIYGDWWLYHSPSLC